LDDRGWLEHEVLATVPADWLDLEAALQVLLVYLGEN
jgi:hypothetical protein